MKISTTIDKHLDDPDEWRIWSMHFYLSGVYEKGQIFVPLELTLASELHATKASPGIYRVGGDDGITFSWDREKVVRQ